LFAKRVEQQEKEKEEMAKAKEKQLNDDVVDDDVKEKQVARIDVSLIQKRKFGMFSIVLVLLRVDKSCFVVSISPKKTIIEPKKNSTTTTTTTTAVTTPTTTEKAKKADVAPPKKVCINTNTTLIAVLQQTKKKNKTKNTLEIKENRSAIRRRHIPQQLSRRQNKAHHNDAEGLPQTSTAEWLFEADACCVVATCGGVD
jgi:hypothetical protein